MGVLVVACVILLQGASSASAGVLFSVSPSLSSPLQVGQTGIQSTLKITNASTPPEAGLNVTLDTITLVPSCGTKAISGPDCPSATVDPGVLRLSPSGTGQPGTACAGTTFTTSVVDASEGKYSFTPAAAPVVLGSVGGGSDVCTIGFTIDVLKAPTKDADPAPGLQTDQIGFTHGQATDGAGGGSFGTSQVTIAPGTFTTSVYWDGNGNLAADPNPFGGKQPSGSSNVALGQSVLHNLATGGAGNLGIGRFALNANTTGAYNVASGYAALYNNKTAGANVADGVNALYHNTGANNTAVGTNSLLNNTTGSVNAALGNGAGSNLSSGSDNIDIANAGTAGDAGKIRIGTAGKQTAAFLAGVSGVLLTGTSQTVVINANGQLGTAAPPAASVKSASVKSASVKSDARALSRTNAQVRRQQQEIDRLQKEVEQLRALVTPRHRG